MALMRTTDMKNFTNDEKKVNAMLDLKKLEVWFITGSQSLYGKKR